MIAKSNIRPANLARHAHARSSETCGSRSTHQYEIVTIAWPEFRRRGSPCAAALTTRGAWALLVKLGSGKVSALLSRGSGLGGNSTRSGSPRVMAHSRRPASETLHVTGHSRD